MNRLTRKILEHNFPTVFTADDLRPLEPEDNKRYCQMKWAMERGDIVRLKRGVYTLNKIFRKELINGHVLANKFVPNSYVSLETALRDAGWIPEFVYEIASVTLGPGKFIKTMFVNFSYVHIPQKDLLAGTEQMYDGEEYYHEAKPLKALADYIYEKKLNWNSLDPLVKSLRIECDDLETLTAKDFDELEGNYKSVNVEEFLKGIRKELQV
jgi:hypothetical protein